MLNNKLDRILYLHPVPPCPKLKKWNKAKETGVGFGVSPLGAGGNVVTLATSVDTSFATI